MSDFTLKDVLSRRILDPVTNEYRNRLPEEKIVLTEAQKNSFVEEFGYRASAKTKQILRNYIESPHQNFSSLWWIERVTWTGDRCVYVGFQSCEDEIRDIRKEIAK